MKSINELIWESEEEFTELTSSENESISAGNLSMNCGTAFMGFRCSTRQPSGSIILR